VKSQTHTLTAEPFLKPLGESTNGKFSHATTGALVGFPRDDRRLIASHADRTSTPTQSELFILINRAEIAGFKHYAAALKAALPKPAPVEAVQHPLGGYTHAVPHKNGTCRIYSGWWSTMAKAVAALPQNSALSHLNPKSK